MSALISSLTGMGLEHYVHNVRTLSQQGSFQALSEFISKNYDLLTKNMGNLDTLYGTFDMQQHSLGILGVLYVKYGLPSIPDWETLFVQTQEFITSCNGEQIRYSIECFSELCHRFCRQLIERKQAVRGIAVLAIAIDKLRLLPSQLTSVHADVCQLCLVAKLLKPALQFIDVDITEINKEGGQYDAKYFLQYYYYGGMIYLALKNYTRAYYFFEVAVTTPALAVSHIMLEAYKKLLLVSLITTGKPPVLPKYTSQVVHRYIKPLCPAYYDLVNTYGSNNPGELRNMVTKHHEVFARDTNQGLVNQCVTALFKMNIQRLTKTFMTLSLTDMANRVQLSGPKEAEKYVLNMIEEREIFATINQRDGMVSFYDSPEHYNNNGMLQKLDGQMQQCIELNTKLREMDREIAVNPQFIQKSSGSHEDDLPGSTSSKVLM